MIKVTFIDAIASTDAPADAVAGAWENENERVFEWLRSGGDGSLSALQVCTHVSTHVCAHVCTHVYTQASLRPKAVAERLAEWESAGGREMMLEVAAQVMAKLGAGEVSEVQALLSERAANA